MCIDEDQEDDISTEGDDGHVLEYIFTLMSHKICPTAMMNLINLTSSSSSSSASDNKGNKDEIIGLEIGIGIVSL